MRWQHSGHLTQDFGWSRLETILNPVPKINFATCKFFINFATASRLGSPFSYPYPHSREGRVWSFRIVLWCNGSTAVFGSACPGSNPGKTTKLSRNWLIPSQLRLNFVILPDFQRVLMGRGKKEDDWEEHNHCKCPGIVEIGKRGRRVIIRYAHFPRIRLSRSENKQQ